MRWSRVGTVLCVLAAACAHAPESRPTEPVVQSVELIGVSALSADEVRSGLVTQATGKFPWSDEHRFDAVALEADLRRITAFYERHGYFDVRVRRPKVVSTGSDKVKVSIAIDEGAPTRVTSITLEGLESLSPDVRASVQEALSLSRGDVLVADAYTISKSRVERVLAEAGYAAATVEGRVDVRPGQHAATVTLTITPGAMRRFGKIRVEGLTTIPDAPVVDAVRRVLPEGDRYSPDAMEEAQTQLRALEVFRASSVSLATNPEDPSRTPVLVEVEETPANAIVLGGGAGIDQNLQQLQLRADYRRLNLFGGARRFTWNNELALRFLPSFFSPNRIGFAFETSVELIQPQLFHRTDGAIRGGYERVFRQAYEAQALDARVGLSWSFSRYSRLLPSLGHTSYFSFRGTEPVGTRPLPLSTTCAAPCRTTTPALQLLVDRRNDPLSTREGRMFLVNLRYGLPTLGGTFHFLRITPEARAYVPLGPSYTLALRARIGALFTLGSTTDSPIVERYFGGGEGDHRGFGAEQLAPLVQDGADSFVPIGGNGQWLTTLEARARFGEHWGAVVFADWGDVTIDALDFDFASAHLALGAGLRYHTLAGPVRFDVAYRVTRNDRVALDTGGTPDDGGLDYLSLFISLGEAF